MTEDMVFCKNCGAKDLSAEEISYVENNTQGFSQQIHLTSTNFEQNKAKIQN